SDPLAIAAIHPAQLRAQAGPSPVPAAKATPAPPAPTPRLVAAPTPIPDGALPPDALPTDAVAEPFLTAADLPVALAFAPDGRLFYDELRTGNIRIVQNGELLPTPFYQFAVSQTGSNGLVGLALDPDFAQNHFVYASYASASGPIEVVRLTDQANVGTDLL